VHLKWVQALEEEFFLQGDREKESGLPVSPLMDREKNGITRSQVGFFDIVALPLFQTFSQAFSESTPMLEAVRDNYTMWRDAQSGKRSMSTNSSESMKASAPHHSLEDQTLKGISSSRPLSC